MLSNSALLPSWYKKIKGIFRIFQIVTTSTRNPVRVCYHRNSSTTLNHNNESTLPEEDRIITEYEWVLLQRCSMWLIVSSPSYLTRTKQVRQFSILVFFVQKFTWRISSFLILSICTCNTPKNWLLQMHRQYQTARSPGLPVQLPCGLKLKNGTRTWAGSERSSAAVALVS